MVASLTNLERVSAKQLSGVWMLWHPQGRQFHTISPDGEAFDDLGAEIREVTNPVIPLQLGPTQ